MKSVCGHGLHKNDSFLQWMENTIQVWSTKMDLMVAGKQQGPVKNVLQDFQ